MTALAILAEDSVAGLVAAGSGCDAAAGAPSKEATVAFRWSADAAPGADVVWSASAADGAPGRLVIAPEGSGLWRRAPWPAADALYELPEPTDALVAVVGGEEAVAERLRARGARVRRCPTLDAAALAAAAVVVVAGESGREITAVAPAVLAARRILVTTAGSPAFGFHAGIDYCAGETDDDLADLVESATRHWEGFASMRAHGFVAAGRHRASRVLAELAFDLELEL